MSLSTLTINGNDYFAYASVGEADIDLAVDPVRLTAWDALTADGKAILLVSSTRRLDLLPWRGARKDGPDQATAWPRSGLTFSDGSDVPTDTIPRDIELATILLAGTIASKPANSNAGTVDRSVRRVRAGSAEIEFSPTAIQRPNPVRIKDETVNSLVSQWLSGQGFGVGSAYGTGRESRFEEDNPFDRSLGYS